jgi:LmbE family N-acetylglucosaminyl deacetylase
MNRTRAPRLLALILLALPALAAAPEAGWPRVLLVTAHPDDDALFGGSVYKITHSLGGRVDVAVVTNGEGGYKYSTLAEPIYGFELTDEKVARERLPGIRKKEMIAGGSIVGIRNYFFLDQKDQEYTTDLEQGIAPWDLDHVRARLRSILTAGGYDFVFVMLPVPTTHAHHQGAALLALEVVSQLPAADRPVVLGGTGYRKSSPERVSFTGRDEFPLTRVRPGAPVFEFDRTRKFGLNDRLDYNIVVNWLIAEHKSQGTMQLLMNGLDVEQYFYFDLNGEAGLQEARTLFDRLAQAPPIASINPWEGATLRSPISSSTRSGSVD